MIKHSALALLAVLALPLSVHAQDGKAGTPAKAASQDRPPASQRDKDDTVHGTVKGTGTASTPRESDTPGVGGADDARANMERTNSQAASSGAVDGRNALAPAGTPMGPSGAPAVGH